MAELKKIDIFFTGIALLLAMSSYSWYCWHIVYGAIVPALATWLIFAVATTLSLISYLKYNDRRLPFITNAANRIDPFLVWMVIGCIVLAPKSDKSIQVFDVACLLSSAIVVLLWWATRKAKKSAMLANLFVQLILVAGYLPTLHKLFSEHRNTESFLTWGFNLLVGILFLVAPFRRRDWLGMVYCGRAILLITLILGVMIYFDHGWLW